MSVRRSFNRGRLRARREIALQFKCPECGAEPGQLCFGKRAAARQAPHRSRYMAEGSTPAAKQPVLRVVGAGDETRAKQLLTAARDRASQDILDTYNWAAARCESPIERILLAAYLHPHTGQSWDMRTDILIPSSGLVEHCQAPPFEGFYLWPQIGIGQYRVDFIFGARRADGDMSWAIIECDGHDFHEKTKGQAQRDKARDRYLVGRGYRVLRYTGSEIYRDPMAVWDEVAKIVLGLCDD